MKYSILILLLIGLVHSCNESDDEFNPTLPLITQTGANTFGCYVDGVLVTPRNGATSSLGHPTPGMIMSSGPQTQEIPYHELRIRDSKSGTGAILNIHFINLDENGEGVFTINESNCYSYVYSPVNLNIFCRIFDNDTQAFKWYCSIENSGELLITRYDKNEGIFSGTFSCKAINRDNPDEIIEITQGRFDINWKLLNNFSDFP
jgi:hypothetical protein